MADKEPQKRVHERWAPYQPWFFFWAPYQLMKRFSPQNGRFGPNFWKTFEDPSQKQPGSLSAIRVPQKEQHFGKISSVPQKEGSSKLCQKIWENVTPPIPQKERLFRVMTPKKLLSLFRRKKAFSAFFQNSRRKKPQVNHMAKSRKPWKN